MLEVDLNSNCREGILDMHRAISKPIARENRWPWIGRAKREIRTSLAIGLAPSAGSRKVSARTRVTDASRAFGSFLLALTLAFAGLPVFGATADPGTPFTGQASAPGDPVSSIIDAFGKARVVALGESHGHQEFHSLVIEVLESPKATGVINDIAVEWGNAKYQDVIDRYVSGEEVSRVELVQVWRNTIVSPNTVWDAPVYEAFFAAVRTINARLPAASRYRVLLADSPVDWAKVSKVADLGPFFDRAKAMADVVRRESLALGRNCLFLAGGLHVSHRSRTFLNRNGVVTAELTPVSWLDLHHPGSTYSVQSMGSASDLGLDELVAAGAPEFHALATRKDLASMPANKTHTLRRNDGSLLEAYPNAQLGDLVDAVITWNRGSLTFPDAEAATYADEDYWRELNRRSQLLGGRGMDPALREAK